VPSIPALQSQLGRSAFLLAVLGVLVAVLLVVRALRRRRRDPLATGVAATALTVALGAALWLTLRPVGAGAGVRTLHLDPIEGAWGWDSIAWNPVIDNVALFVPIGALAVAWAWRRSPLLVWFACVLLSASIETLQFLLPIGRVANAADLLANAVGAALGVLLAAALGVRRQAIAPRAGTSRAGRQHVS